MLEVGALICGFLVTSVVDLPDAEGRMWRMEYEKNGAELVWLERKDEVKTFVIGFKTLPEDDTGVAHILEHSVLSGSGKYPVKSPFDELRKSSLRVFMNAMTGRDRTYYPFSTRNNQDFLNLADVYLDAVFDPTVIRNPLAFKQEGWHYVIDEKTGALSVNGVVYNEMKGVFADPERAAEWDVLGYLYPDTVYGKNSGGKPEAIPNLTYEKFCAFYKKFYHPSNARIFLDGSVDLPSILSKLDGYLKRYERAESVTIPLHKPILCKKRIPYGSTNCERKTILVDAWSIGKYSDIDKRAMLDVLTYYLVGSNEAPLKKALLSEGVCEDARLYWYAYKQMPMVLVIRNTTDEAAEKCREIVRKTLSKLLTDGVDRKRLHAIIDKNEFAEREINTSHPRGLVYFSRAFGQWLYGGDPAAEFDITGIYARLRKSVDTGEFEKCLRETFLESPHHVELTFSPDAKLVDETSKRIDSELARRRSLMSEADIEKLKEECREIAEYQARKDSNSAKASIPALKVSDIPASGHIVDHSIRQEGDVTIIKTKPTSKGVVYVAAYFPIDGLDADDLVKIPLLARLYGRLPTKKYDTLSLQTELMSTIGRMSSSVVAAERGNYFRVSFAVLESKVGKALDLVKEVLHETRFDDVENVKKIHKQKLNSAERQVRTQGNAISRSIAARKLSRRCASNDILDGLSQLRWLQNAGITETLLKDMQTLAQKIFVRDGLVLSYTDNLSSESESGLRAMFPASCGGMMKKAQIVIPPEEISAIRIDGDTGYSGTVAALPKGRKFNGSMRVAARIVSLDYLLKEIREKGGAYGTGMGISSLGLVSTYTYRNPTPVKSLDVIKGSGEALRSFINSDRELDRYIVATVSTLDPYRSPAGEAFVPVSLYINNRTFADVEAERRQTIETRKEDLAEVAEILDSILLTAEHVVVGGERQTKDLPPAQVQKLERGK